MHKRIYESIKEVIEKSILAKDCEIFVKPNLDGYGFWKMIVIVQQEYHISHIKAVAKHIGNMNGEGLFIEVTNKKIIHID